MKNLLLKRITAVYVIVITFLKLVYSADDDDVCVTFRGIGGTHSITTPNFPEKYLPNVDCVRIIRAIEGHDIVLKFKDIFEIETSYDPNSDGRIVVSDCPNDFVEIRDGRYGFSPLLVRLCGKTIPTQELRATSGFMWIRFYSDEILQYKGFHAVYNFTAIDPKRVNMQEFLRKELTSLDGYVKSDDLFPFLSVWNFTYPLDFVWRLTVPSEFRIAFYFEEFSLYAPNHCEDNFFEIYSGSTSHTPIKRFCGLTSSDAFSQHNVMFARLFLSDARLLKATKITALYSAYIRLSNCSAHDLYECGDENCLPKALVCNGRKNCPYERDEALCHLAQDALAAFVKSGFFPLAVTVFLVSIVVFGIIVWTYRLKCIEKRDKMSQLPELHLEPKPIQLPGIVIFAAENSGDLSD